MAQEVETKILEVDKTEISQRLDKLGAEKNLETRLKVWWFRPVGSKQEEIKWFLRLRTYSDGKAEVTWKGPSEIVGLARKHEEINFTVSDPEEMVALFAKLGLGKRAYQEKDRISWSYQDWKIDLDQYPGMPAYLEIEGRDEEHIKEAIQILGLEKHKTSSDGERVMITNEYGLNWYDMKF